MELPLCCCWQHGAGGKRRRKRHDPHEVDVSSSGSDSEETSEEAATTDTESESEEVPVPQRGAGIQDHEDAQLAPEQPPDSLHFPGLFHCCGPTLAASGVCCGDGEESEVERDLGDAAATPGRRRPRVVEERELTQSFRLEVDHMPELAAPDSDPQHLIVDEQRLEGLTLDAVEDALLDDTVMQDYLEGYSKSYDISLSDWGTTPGGVRVRRARFTMPVPQDVPAAIARLAAVPKTSRATLVMGFRRVGEEELLVQLQQVTHEVPQGEAFRVQEMVRFRPHREGGLACSKWTVVKWVKALPWLMTPMKPITESKTAVGAKDASVVFLRAVQKAVG